MKEYSFPSLGGLRLSVFGESHAPFVGARLEGIPAGTPLDMDLVSRMMEMRSSRDKPGATKRQEADEIEFAGGISGGRCDGSPVEIRIRNGDARPRDYDRISHVPRPGHADLAAWMKYGSIPSGGGAFSGRMTAPLTAAGGVVLSYLHTLGIKEYAHLFSVGEVFDIPYDPMAPIDNSDCGMPVISPKSGKLMRMEIESAQRAGDSVGGTVECAFTGVPSGLGGPLFEGAEGRLSLALYAVPAVKCVEFGSGFAASRLRGSVNNDQYAVSGGKVTFLSNNCGGILGGITTGTPLIMRAAVKPTPSISLPQRSVDLDSMEDTTLEVGGRHDTCVALRALPAVLSAASLALCDMILSREDK